MNWRAVLTLLSSYAGLMIITIKGKFTRDVGPNWRLGFTLFLNGSDPISYACGPKHWTVFKVMQDGRDNRDDPKKGAVTAIAIAEQGRLPLPWMNRANYTLRTQWWDAEGRTVMDFDVTYELGRKDGDGWGFERSDL